MKFYFLFFYIFLISNVTYAKLKKPLYQEKYVYKIKYLGVNMGTLSINIIHKQGKKQHFRMQLDTKKSLSWMYKLHQSVVAKFNKNFFQLTEWKNIKEEKSRKTYEHVGLGLLPTSAKIQKIQLIHYNKKNKIINKNFVLLPKNKALHSTWTLPWYIAFSSWKDKENEIINLLYKKKIIKAKVILLKTENSLILGKKKKSKVFSISSSKNKNIQLKVWVSQYKENTIVSSFNLKLKLGQLKASLKSYKKENL